ncbi:putative ribonuclease H-like domain-containing protein [Tanacetum coccineum]
MTVPATIKEKTCKKNDVKARTRFGGNEATKKTQKALLKQQYANFSASRSESLDSIFNRLQKLVSRLEILGVVTPPEDLNKSAGASNDDKNLAFVTTSGASSTNNINTVNPEVSTVTTKVNTASTEICTASFSDATVYAFLSNQSNKGKESSIRELEGKSSLMEAILLDMINQRYNVSTAIKWDILPDDEEQDGSKTKPEKKTVIPTAAKIEKPVRKPVKYAEMYRSVNTGNLLVLRSFNIVRPSYTAHPKSIIHCARPRTYFQNQAQSTVHRPFYKRTTLQKGVLIKGLILILKTLIEVMLLLVEEPIEAELLAKIYVDDIIFGSTKKELCDEFEKLMKDKFQMSSMGELTFFLGFTESTETERHFISQIYTVNKILRKLKLPQISMIGSLMYLTASRPDIMFPVCACARFQVSPKTSHLLAVKRIFRYLKGKPSLGL